MNPPPAAPRQTRHLATVLLILLAAALAAAPIWFHGPVGADDFEFHLISWLDAQRIWLAGTPYPHWAFSSNFGAGEPRFVFYPPLSWMLGAALGLILPWTLVPVTITFLILSGTAFATRALAHQTLPRLAPSEAPATIAACTAIFSTYALFSAYDRMAFGELLGGVWIPLLLLYLFRERHPTATPLTRALDGSTLPLALTLAACWLSDAPVGVMASYLLAAVAVLLALLRRSWAPILRATVAAPLGIALTGFYLIPAAWQQRWVDILQAAGVHGDRGLLIENNWIFPHHTDPILHARDLALHVISPITVFMVAVALASLIVLALRRRMPARTEWIPLALIPAAVLLLQFPISLPVWNLFPKLRFLQFPWRWLLAVEAPMAVLFAAAVWPASSPKRWLRPAVASLCILFFLGTTLVAAGHFFRDAKEDDDLTTILDKYRTGTGFIGTDEYAPPGADNSVVATGLPDACFSEDFDTELGIAPTTADTPVWLPSQSSCLATATAQLRLPEQLRLTAVSPRNGFVILRLRTYPAWRILLNGRPADPVPGRLDGLIALPVTQGPITLAIDWRTTPDVWVGRSVTLLALFGLTVLAFFERKLSRPA